MLENQTAAITVFRGMDCPRNSLQRLNLVLLDWWVVPSKVTSDSLRHSTNYDVQNTGMS